MVIYFALHGVALHYQLPVPVHCLDRQRNETFTIPLKVHRENKTKNNKTLIIHCRCLLYLRLRFPNNAPCSNLSSQVRWWASLHLCVARRIPGSVNLWLCVSRIFAYRNISVEDMSRDCFAGTISSSSFLPICCPWLLWLFAILRWASISVGIPNIDHTNKI